MTIRLINQKHSPLPYMPSSVA